MELEMDDRIRFFLEQKMRMPLSDLPTEGIEIRESSRNKDAPWKRLSISRVGNGALVTGISRIIRAVEPVIQNMSIWELFHPYGLAELRYALSQADGKSLREGFHYTLAEKQYIHPADTSPAPVKVLVENEDPENKNPQSGLQRSSSGKYFQPAFAVYDNGKEAAYSGIHWVAPEIVEIGVETQETHRKRGYGFVLVAAATEWVLNQGALAYYRVFPTNTASIHIARKLGYKLTWQNIYA
ncbi:GNAT family N-acetyltransferase [Thermodesulfobacteriota bacterium]